MPQREQVHPFLRDTLLDIKQSGKRSYSPDSPCRDDILHSHTLLYCTKGNGELIIDASSSKMGRKTLLLIPPQMNIAIHPSPQQGLDYSAIGNKMAMDEAENFFK
ncbi:hypothetical protein [Brevibacillus choshinensis]|uniref:AraC-type arabinose-binding/dimerisation domain-containing protein n=1 Tax=Brevibacillus choshinensis TaxID=54911 RepID=A0ABX7FPI6_BRECH|nr:hypothetical protein [Brevibacillus choshinensis]QRG67610.1 hypothetical protein JNE38_30015 [Brevibacillus choshinensis]